MQEQQQQQHKRLRDRRTSGSGHESTRSTAAVAIGDIAEVAEASLAPASVASAPLLPSLQRPLPPPPPPPVPAPQHYRALLVLPRTPAGPRIVTLGGGSGTLTPAVSRRYVTESDSLAKAWPGLAARLNAAAPLTSRPSVESSASDEGATDSADIALESHPQPMASGLSAAVSAAPPAAGEAVVGVACGDVDSAPTPALLGIHPSRIMPVPTTSFSVAEGSDRSTGSEHPTPPPSHHALLPASDAMSIASRAHAASPAVSAVEATVATSSPSQAQNRAKVAAAAAAAMAVVNASAAAVQQHRAASLRIRYLQDA